MFVSLLVCLFIACLSLFCLFGSLFSCVCWFSRWPVCLVCRSVCSSVCLSVCCVAAFFVCLFVFCSFVVVLLCLALVCLFESQSVGLLVCALMCGLCVWCVVCVMLRFGDPAQCQSMSSTSVWKPLSFQAAHTVYTFLPCTGLIVPRLHGMPRRQQMPNPQILCCCQCLSRPPVSNLVIWWVWLGLESCKRVSFFFGFRVKLELI